MSLIKSIGAHRLITAPRIDSIFGEWESVGLTRGEVVVTIHEGKIAMGRVDQVGVTPLSGAIYYLGQSVELTFPLAERSIDTLLRVAPGSVKDQTGQLEAVGFGSIPKYVESRAFALVPEFVWREASMEALISSPWVHWIREGFVDITGSLVNNLPEGDDALADSVLECQLRQVSDGSVHEAGIGSLFILPDPVDIMGSNNDSQLEAVAPDSALRSALSGIDVVTVRQLSQRTAPIDFSGGSISNALGMQFAVRSADIDLSGNDIEVIPLFAGFDHLESLNLAGNEVPQDMMSDFINQMWLIREAIGANTATLNVSGNNGLNQKAQDQVNGTGSFVGEGLVDHGVTVIV